MEIQNFGTNGVTSINNLTGAVTLAAGSNITLTPVGNTITIAATTSSAVSSVSNADGTLTISPTTGAVVASRPAITGDVTIAGGSNASVLATVNGNVGTFASVTVNGKGLVTAATALSGDITTSGAVTTLATVNGNVGSFTYASITVNAKGLITAASSGTAPVTTIGTFGGSIANGMSISSNTLTLGAADASNPGGVSTGTQTFAGAKTFTGNVTINTSTTLTKQNNSLGTNSVDGIILLDNSAASGGVPVQNSPRIKWTGAGLNGASASETVSFFVDSRPVNGATPINANLTFGYISAAPATTTLMFLNSSGYLGIGQIAGAYVDIIGSTTAAASMRIRAGTAPTSPNEGDMWADSTQKAIYMFADGIKQSGPGVLFTQTADKTVTNTVTETSIVGTGVGGLTLPANFWVAGKTIRVTMSGVYSTVAITGDTVTIKIKYGSTVLASKATSALVTGGTNLFWSSEVLVTCRTTGATGTVQVSGGVIYQIAGSATVEDELNNGAAPTTLDTTAGGLFDVTITHSGANASNTVTSLVSAFEVLN